MSDRTCSIDGCEKSAVRKKYGWCEAHYSRWRRYGNPVSLSFAKGRTADQRFWQHVDRSAGEYGCWPWTGGLLNNGYGSFRFERKGWPAHRWLWVQRNGPIADGLVVRHKCDTPACVNPMHHELGTPADNSADCVRRGRSAKGSRNGYSKLNEDAVRRIKIALRSGVPRATLADLNGVTKGCIDHICTGRSWSHVVV